MRMKGLSRSYITKPDLHRLPPAACKKDVRCKSGSGMDRGNYCTKALLMLSAVCFICSGDSLSLSLRKSMSPSDCSGTR